MASEVKSIKLQKENDEARKEYASIENDLMLLATESNMTIREQANRLQSLQFVMPAQTEKTNNLENSISKALMNYKTDELDVYQKDGKVYVSLAEKLLFKSGNDVVDPKEKSAFKTLAIVLNSSNAFTVAIEGHVVDVPVRNKVFEDNWDLSTASASSKVRIFTTDKGIDSGRITTSGKSQFHPASENTTDEGRADNRKTEVMLSPDLQDIYRLLY